MLKGLLQPRRTVDCERLTFLYNPVLNIVVRIDQPSSSVSLTMVSVRDKDRVLCPKPHGDRDDEVGESGRRR